MPELKISLHKTFATREELDAFVRSTFGENAEKNGSIVIEASGEALTAIGLSETDTVFGVKVRAKEKKK